MSLQDPTNEREIHQRNIRDMQEQLQEAYKRINALNNEIEQLKTELKDK
tara:strand:- start:1485 stop:1631 length:147 start_codon:yes stop_codon:yes gene_type:complete